MGSLLEGWPTAGGGGPWCGRHRNGVLTVLEGKGRYGANVPDDPFDAAAADAAILIAKGGPPDVAIVLGSGWAEVAGGVGTVTTELPFGALAGFPQPSVGGHEGVVRWIEVGATRAVALVGRSHLYEGRSPAQVVHGVRAAVLAGARVVILTNAAGGIRAGLRVGDPVLLSDHLNLTGASPLAGPPPPPSYPPRFADLSAVYSPRLRAIARDIDPTIAEGVYAALLGGAYETPAEIRMLQGFGADLVGMSTALEAIAAVHLGAEVLGISLVTNLAAGLGDGGLDHQEVLAAGASSSARLAALLRGVLERL